MLRILACKLNNFVLTLTNFWKHKLLLTFVRPGYYKVLLQDPSHLHKGEAQMAVEKQGMLKLVDLLTQSLTS